MLIRLIAVAMIGAAVYAQHAKPVIDNERVTVWDVTGEPRLVRTFDHDVVVMQLTGSHARTATFIPKGGAYKPAGARSLLVELKDHPVPRLENKTGYPPAFPRPRAVKLLENDRVIAWSYRWNPGEPTSMHFHDKDVVVVYLEPTALTSTTPEGAKTLNEYQAFDIRFNKGDRTHTELLERGTGSAMMLELK